MLFFRRWAWAIFLFLFSFTAFYVSGIDSGTSHDRLKYLSIAWSMYQNGDFFISTMNGIPYTDKPPLLFWLIALSWHLFGVNMFGPQLIIFCSYIIWGLLTQAIYATIFPEDKLGKYLTPYVLLGSCVIWQGTWFLRVDLLLVTGVLLCNLGIIRLLISSNKNKSTVSFWLIIFGTCIGLFGKGPVVYVFTLLPFLATLVFIKSYRQHTLKIISAILLGTFMMAAVWAIPAAMIMGYDFAKQIFFMQIAHRAIRTEVPPYVKRSYFIYLYQYLPILFLPWVINIVFFRKMKALFQKIENPRWFIVMIFIVSLLILSFFGQKTSWYILPLLPFGVIFFTRFFIEYSHDLSVIWLNRIVLGVSFFLLGGVCIAFVISPNFLHYSFKNFGEDFSIKPGLMYALAIFSFSTSCFLFFSKSLVKAIAFASIIFFVIYTAMNVYFSVLERNFTQLDQAAQILHQQEFSQKSLVLYNPSGEVEYLGQFNYMAKLKAPIFIFTKPTELKRWLTKNPHGIIIYSGEQYPAIEDLQVVASFRERVGGTRYLLCQILTRE